jgi:hypothetical protein
MPANIISIFIEYAAAFQMTGARIDGRFIIIIGRIGRIRSVSSIGITCDDRACHNTCSECTRAPIATISRLGRRMISK